MKKKYMFFDIDGTLTNGFLGTEPTVSKLTIATLRQLEAQGHFVAIATGRPYFMAKDIAEEVAISNLVCNGGNDVYINHECIAEAPMDRDFALKIIDECLAKNIPFSVSYDESLHRITHSQEFADLIKVEHFLGELELIENFDYHSLAEFKRIFVVNTHHDKDLPKEIIDCSYHKSYLVVEPDDKFKGIEKVMEYYHAPIEDVVVFGDGMNDLSMFQKAHISIAMGNAVQPLKDIASFVTHNSDQDGILFACQHYGWL